MQLSTMYYCHKTCMTHFRSLHQVKSLFRSSYIHCKRNSLYRFCSVCDLGKSALRPERLLSYRPPYKKYKYLKAYATVVMIHYMIVPTTGSSGRVVENQTDYQSRGTVVQSHLPPFRNLHNLIHPTFVCVFWKIL